MPSLVEVLADSRYTVDGVGQAEAVRVFEYEGVVDNWKAEIDTVAPINSPHPFYPNVKVDRHVADPLIGNARGRVSVLYSSNGKYSRFVYVPRKQGDEIQWTQGGTYVEDEFFINESVISIEADNPEPVVTWQPRAIHLNKQPRELRRCTVALPNLTADQLKFITSQNGKLHFDPGGGAEPEPDGKYTSGRWFMFEAPEGLETTREEIRVTYMWRGDSGIRILPIQFPPATPPDPAPLAAPTSIYGYFRLPFHKLVPYYLGGDRTVQTSNLQVITAEDGGVGGFGWLSLPGIAP